MRYIQFNFRPHIRRLDDLLLEAQGYAQAVLEAVGSVRPTLLAVSPQGVFAHYPEQTTSEADKDLFAEECRLLLTTTRATMCAMILESWLADIPAGKIPGIPPSQAPNRKEVVTVCAEIRKEERFLIFPLHRDTSGRFREFELEEHSTPERLKAVGRFAQMLPVASPRQKHMEVAQRTLVKMDIYLGGNDRNFSMNRGVSRRSVKGTDAPHR